MKLLKKTLTFAVSAIIICAALTSCADKNAAEHSKYDESSVSDVSGVSGDSEVRELGSFIITLYPEYAPITCENFEKLVSEGFYDGLTFHRVYADFMAQGGDPNGDGTGGSDETITGEFSENGIENNLSHTRGVVSMARSSDYDSASSQFFICYTDDDTFLDGQYAAFGEVTEGMEVVDSFLTATEITYSSSGELSSPVDPITIASAEMIEDDEDGNPRAQFTITVG